MSTDAMIQVANISPNSARIINHHLYVRTLVNHYLYPKQSSGNILLIVTPPTVKIKALVGIDNSMIADWYKCPDLNIQKQLKDVIDFRLLKNLIWINIPIWGDHGGGRSHMNMKLNVHLPKRKPSLS